jgi:anti-sigma-K factor RskA
MKELQHEEVAELIPAYVLGAVPDDEMRLVRAHILSCDLCLAEADRFAETTSSLALSAEAVPLPVGFADRVVAAATGGQTATTEKVAPQRARLPRFQWSFIPAASFLVLIIAVVSMSVAWYQADRAVQRQERAIAAIIQGHRGIDMQGPGAVATLVPTESGSLFVASGLKNAPNDRTYQLWLLDGEVPTSAGTFNVDDGLVMFESSKSINGYSGAAVTIEPQGGSPSPTGVQVVTSFS